MKNNQNFEMVATTLFGLEEVLAKELRNLGAQSVNTGVRNVRFYGDKGFLYKANIALRTALRILKPIYKFRFRNEAQFYDQLQKILWENHMSFSGSFSVTAVGSSPFFTSNTHYTALKTKDAIADYFRSKYGKRPSVALKYPDVALSVHLQKDFCTVSLDSSGVSLHQRGYRKTTNIAPINEVLAAGLLQLSNYDGSANLIDPMCGSGTILIEAAMIACNIPAGVNRPFFAFEKWLDYDEELHRKIETALVDKIKNMPCKIMGFDKAPSAIKKAKENIENARLEDFIGVHHVNFFNSKKEVFGDTILVFNPPYGERLPLEKSVTFYKEIGDTLKNHYPETTAWMLTADMTALKKIGLRTSRRIPLKNGALDCRFVCYEMYEGSKKNNANNTA